MKLLLTIIFVTSCGLQIVFCAKYVCNCKDVSRHSEYDDYCNVSYIAQVHVTKVEEQETPTIRTETSDGGYFVVLGDPLPTIYTAQVLQTFKDGSVDAVQRAVKAALDVDVVTIKDPNSPPICELVMEKDQTYVVAGKREGNVIYSDRAVGRCNVWNQPISERLTVLQSGNVPFCSEKEPK